MSWATALGSRSRCFGYIVDPRTSYFGTSQLFCGEDGSESRGSARTNYFGTTQFLYGNDGFDSRGSSSTNYVFWYDFAPLWWRSALIKRNSQYHYDAFKFFYDKEELDSCGDPRNSYVRTIPTFCDNNTFDSMKLLPPIIWHELSDEILVRFKRNF